MSIRIVSEKEVREALSHNGSLAADREHVLNELDAVREYIGWSPQKQAWADGPVGASYRKGRYPLDLIDEIEKIIKSWPEPLTAEDLTKGES